MIELQNQTNNPSQTFKDVTKNRFIGRLNEVMDGLSNNAFAIKCGLNEKTIRKYTKGETYPTLESLALISYATNKPIEWFVSQSNDIGLKSDAGDFIVIPDLNLKVAAGNGLVPLNENELIGEFTLNKEWLRRNKLLNKKLAIFHVDGDSMEPTISDDDIALVSIRDDNWATALNGIFILRVDDALFIKRIQVDMIEKGIHIISDNPMYQRNFIKIDESTEARIKVIAKVERILTKAIPMKNLNNI